MQRREAVRERGTDEVGQSQRAADVFCLRARTRQMAEEGVAVRRESAGSRVLGLDELKQRPHAHGFAALGAPGARGGVVGHVVQGRDDRAAHATSPRVRTAKVHLHARCRLRSRGGTGWGLRVS
eukprot:1904135-Rhodomonas_salina.1